MTTPRPGTWLAGWVLVFCCGTLAPARAQAPPAPEKPAAVELSEERLRRAWSFLSPAEQQDTATYLRAALKQSSTFQQSLIDFARSLEPRDLGLFPLAPPTPFYAPDIHAPRQPIERRRLSPEDPRALRLQNAMLAAWKKNGLRSAWHYDWGTREVLRAADEADPTRVFMNALAGHAPDIDLGQALIERALDDGAQQASLAAFGHAYTDRSGNVYPGLTLYDAWASGTDMEMPDVDVLGVIHDLAKDWKTWTAPVPDTQHDELYAKVGGYFLEAKRQRGMRTALALTFFSGSIALRADFSPHRDRLHSFWDEHSSTPADLAAQLPKLADLPRFLEQWAARIDDDVALVQRGRVRKATLDLDSQHVRATAIAILQEFGAFERTSRPPPPPEPAPEGTKKRDQ